MCNKLATLCRFGVGCFLNVVHKVICKGHASQFYKAEEARINKLTLSTQDAWLWIPLLFWQDLHTLPPIGCIDYPWLWVTVWVKHRGCVVCVSVFFFVLRVLEVMNQVVSCNFLLIHQCFQLLQAHCCCCSGSVLLWSHCRHIAFPLCLAQRHSCDSRTSWCGKLQLTNLCISTSKKRHKERTQSLCFASTGLMFPIINTNKP